jgi:SAM-dependent methyltransferase
VSLADFHSRVRQQGLDRHAHQWASLVTCSQERLVYRKALELPRNARVLDWGCGNGHFSYFLAQSGFRPEAYALSDTPALLQGTGIAFTKGGDRVALPYADASFDAVFGLGVLEHITEHGGSEKGSLAELVRVLKPGGLLFIFHLPNRWSWIEAAKWCTWRLGLTTTREHVRHFTRSGLLALVSEFPLEVLDDGRYHFLPRATLGRLPGLGNSVLFDGVVNAADDVLARLLAPISQNWYFVLRKT